MLHVLPPQLLKPSKGPVNLIIQVRNQITAKANAALEKSRTGSTA